jgi:nucleotide-binding universal stress UspA family protein
MNAARKILVPVNFSEDSADGLKYAVSLAQKTQSELIVLHVTQKKDADSFLDLLAVMEGYPMSNRPAGIPIDRLLRERALDLYHFVQKIVRNPGRLKIIRKVALGNKAETILQVIKDESIDLVVLAVRNRSFFPYLLARGKLLKMISRFPCPVLLKPPSGEPWAASGTIRPWIFAR